MNVHNAAPVPDRKVAIDPALPHRAGHVAAAPASMPLVAPVLFAIIAGIDGLGTSIAFAALIFAGPLAAGFGMGVGVIPCRASSSRSLLRSAAAIPPASVRCRRRASPSLPHRLRRQPSISMRARRREGCNCLRHPRNECRFDGSPLLDLRPMPFRSLVRFMPYPVVAGFLAGSGWLLIQGAVMMIVGERGAVRALRPSRGSAGACQSLRLDRLCRGHGLCTQALHQPAHHAARDARRWCASSMSCLR